MQGHIVATWEIPTMVKRHFYSGSIPGWNLIPLDLLHLQRFNIVWLFNSSCSTLIISAFRSKIVWFRYCLAPKRRQAIASTILKHHGCLFLTILKQRIGALKTNIWIKLWLYIAFTIYSSFMDKFFLLLIILFASFFLLIPHGRPCLIWCRLYLSLIQNDRVV